MNGDKRDNFEELLFTVLIPFISVYLR
jgi:hypothetical protein